jgi:ABC-2 type transport system permease protein|tara:strand:+ start:62 stop:856 length:795 start_codon:yes stop_codon:yes gene_type:complete
MNNYFQLSTAFFVLLKREITRFLSLYRQTIIPGVISSGLYIIVFGHALGDRIRNNQELADAGGYMLFIIPGLIMMSVINHSYQNTSSSLMQAKFLKFLDDILITPLSGLEISIAYIIGGAIRGIINAASIILLSYLIADGFTIDNYFMTFIYIAIVSWAFSALGLLVGIYAKSWDHIGVFTNFVFMPLTMLGGVFWSISMLKNEFLQTISLLNPIYWMIQGLRESMIPNNEPFSYLALIISLSFAVIFTFIASYLFSKGYKIKS